MEAWVPLFNIFLNSSTPESEASCWLQQSFNASSSATFPANSFIALLTKLSDAILIDSSSPLSSSSSDSKRVMLIETLPNLVQTRILSFLAHEHSKFCSRDLFGLVRNVLNGSQPIDFWVRKAAYNLLAKLSQSNPELGYNLNVNSVSKLVGNEFYEMPSWSKDAEDILFLPWLPLSLDELKLATFSSASAENVRLFIEVDEDEEIEKPEEIGEGNNNVSPLHSLLDPEFRAIAASLKEQVLDFHSTSKTVELADKIRQLCLEIWRDSFAILALIEPWKADDETLAILLSRILGDSGEEELGWPSQVLCSTILPKLLVLEEPASRVLVSATMEYCKLHQKAAEYALLFPLILRKDGINNPICDVVTRIIKECFHTAHIASFCQKLLCVEDITKRLMCLPSHQPLLSDKVIWTEPLFSLFQNILNHNVHLTQDSIDHLVYKVRELAERFSMSLKFGNFLLCFVTKCSASLSSHERRLTEAVNLTNTLVTKSVLAKLASL